jgi:hypothetical protein
MADLPAGSAKAGEPVNKPLYIVSLDRIGRIAVM